MDPTVASYVVLAVVAVAAAVVGGLSGVGSGMLVAIFTAPIVGVAALVPTIAVAMLVAHVARVWVYRREIRWDIAAVTSAAAVPAAVAGSALYAQLPTDTIGILIGCFLVASVPLRRLAERRSLRLGRAGLLAASAGFGFLSGTTIGGGVLAVPVFMAAGLLGLPLVATDAVVGLAIQVTRAVAYGGFDLLSARLVTIGVLIGICMVPGTYAARWLMRNLDLRIHTVAMEAVILIGGLSFIWRSVNGT